jgi:hypothetical protein
LETKLEPCSLSPKAQAGLQELLDRCGRQVATNIADKATEALAHREINIKIKFAPESDRRAIDITLSATTKLAAAAKHSSRLYTGSDADGNTYLFDQDPRQELLFKPTPPKENMLDFKTQSAGS